LHPDPAAERLPAIHCAAAGRIGRKQDPECEVSPETLALTKKVETHMGALMEPKDKKP
jgi:hypothetical protein